MSTSVLKDAELQEYYEAMFVMFGSRGWTKLMEDVGRMQQTHDNLTGVETVEQLYFRKGQVDQMNWLAGLRDACERAYQGLLDDQENAPPADEPTGGRAQVVEPGRPE